MPEATYTLNVNGKSQTVTTDGNLPLLWALRDVVGLTGTKYGWRRPGRHPASLTRPAAHDAEWSQPSAAAQPVILVMRQTRTRWNGLSAYCGTVRASRSASSSSSDCGGCATCSRSARTHHSRDQSSS